MRAGMTARDAYDFVSFSKVCNRHIGSGKKYTDRAGQGLFSVNWAHPRLQS